MKVTVEGIPAVDVGNSGIMIRIRDEEGKNLGRFWVGQARVRWAPDSTRERNAKCISVQDFVNYLNELS